jgi:drug/metabolite transporter, DME family
MLLETVLGPVWAWLILGQSPGRSTLAGGALIVGALVTHAAIGLRRSVPPPAPR